jgi:hypothetical protein
MYVRDNFPNRSFIASIIENSQRYSELSSFIMLQILQFFLTKSRRNSYIGIIIIILLNLVTNGIIVIVIIAIVADFFSYLCVFESHLLGF